MTTDLLFQIFQQHLSNPDCKIVSSKEFIQKVVRTYLIFLSGAGTIPQAHVEDVVEDLEAEVLEMFRKKTYGFYNLKEYRQSLSANSNTEPTKSSATSDAVIAMPMMALSEACVMDAKLTLPEQPIDQE